MTAAATVTVRDATADDIDRITEIYAHAVLHGTGTFEIDPPDRIEMRSRVNAVVGAGLPYLVAEREGAVAGFAYAVQFRPRAGYARTVEGSVYIDPAHHRRGVGRALLEELIARCEALGKLQMVAVIGDSANAASIGLHTALGFTHAGTLRDVGYKFDRFCDAVLMQRALTP